MRHKGVGKAASLGIVLQKRVPKTFYLRCRRLQGRGRPVRVLYGKVGCRTRLVLPGFVACFEPTRPGSGHSSLPNLSCMLRVGFVVAVAVPCILGCRQTGRTDRQTALLMQLGCAGVWLGFVSIILARPTERPLLQPLQPPSASNW